MENLELYACKCMELFVVFIESCRNRQLTFNEIKFLYEAKYFFHQIKCMLDI